MFELLNIRDLKTLAEVVEGELKGENTQFENLVIDSRISGKTSVFIALHGEIFDGNIYCSEALSNGCCAVITNDPNIIGRSILVKDTYMALLKLAKNQLNHVNPKTLAITGSNGKTTVKEMIGCILPSETTVITKDNENNEFGILYTVLKIKESTSHLILECGARKNGDFDLIAKYLDFDALVLTNLNNSHIGIFGSEENIQKTKLKLIDGLKPGGVLVEAAFKDLSKSSDKQEIEEQRINTYLISENSKVILKDSWLYNCSSNDSELGVYIIESKSDKQIEQKTDFKFSLNLGIKHNSQNALLGLAVSREWGISKRSVVNALDNFSSPQKNRFYQMKVGRHIVIDDSYNANPTSVRSALSELFGNPNYPENKVVILGDMYELGDASDEEHDKVLDELIKLDQLKLTILVGERLKKAYMRLKDPHQANHIVHIERKSEFPHEQFKESLKDDSVILIKGSRGMKMERFLEIIIGNIR